MWKGCLAFRKGSRRGPGNDVVEFSVEVRGLLEGGARTGELERRLARVEEVMRDGGEDPKDQAPPTCWKAL